MSYARSKAEAKEDIMSVEMSNEASMMGSPILHGKSQGGPAGKGDLMPKTYSLSRTSERDNKTNPHP